MVLSRRQVINWLNRYALILEQNKEYLTQLDAEIGDADHGINMERGFKKVLSQLPSLADKDIGAILKGTGMALISSVGGASGPLYGTFFLRAGAVTADKTELNLIDLTGLFQAGLSGVVERGRAQPGDKTMVDVLAPVVEALKLAVTNSTEFLPALDGARRAAEIGMQSTIQMQARKGRASYLGERSIGHQDPGATSACLMLKALYEAASEQA